MYDCTNQKLSNQYLTKNLEKRNKFGYKVKQLRYPAEIYLQLFVANTPIE